MTWRGSVFSLAAGLLALGTSPAAATVNHGDFVGTSVVFEQVTETTSSGDLEPLWGAPIVLGNQLLFFPAAFAATATGAGGFDQTSSQLQLNVNADPLVTIDELLITEFGDVNLGGTGTAAPRSSPAGAPEAGPAARRPDPG